MGLFDKVTGVFTVVIGVQILALGLSQTAVRAATAPLSTLDLSSHSSLQTVSANRASSAFHQAILLASNGDPDMSGRKPGPDTSQGAGTR